MANLQTPKAGKFDNADMTFVLGHELQHAENAKASEKVLQTVWQGMNDKAKEAKQPHDYTALVDKLIDSNRRDEAGAEIAGWNAAVSRLQASGTEKPTYKQLYEANPFRMADFIDKSPGNPATYTLKDGLTWSDGQALTGLEVFGAEPDAEQVEADDKSRDFSDAESFFSLPAGQDDDEEDEDR